jgi:hypothetical protein
LIVILFLFFGRRVNRRVRLRASGSNRRDVHRECNEAAKDSFQTRLRQMLEDKRVLLLYGGYSWREYVMALALVTPSVRLRRLKLIAICLPCLLFTKTFSWFSDFKIHLVPYGCCLMAQHLPYPRTDKKRRNPRDHGHQYGEGRPIVSVWCSTPAFRIRMKIHCLFRWCRMGRSS